MANELNIPGFKHYELASTYQAKLTAGEVNAKDLSFVKETGKIYTQGGEYGGGDVEIIKVYAPPQPNSFDGLTESQIAENAMAFTRIWNAAHEGKPHLIYINGVVQANNFMADSGGSFIRITAPMFTLTNYQSYHGMAKTYIEVLLVPDGRSEYEMYEEAAPNPEGGEVGKNYLEVRELKKNDDMTVTEEQKAYNIDTFNKAQAGEIFALSADGFVFNLSTVSTLYVRFSFVGPSPFDNRELLSMNATLFADGTFEPSYLDYCTVDSAMSDESENAVQNKVVKKYIDDAVAGATPNITVDSALSDTSTNPVQNKVVTNALANKMDNVTLSKVATSGSYNDLSDKPIIPAGTIVDTSMSLTSINPVQNKVITNALADKVDKVTGKGLSTNDYTTTEKNKLAGIAEGAEVNVQSDWNATSGDAYIKNKPSLSAVATSGSYNDLSNKPTIPSAVTESTVSGWGFTKNTGTYSKPSGGIPKSDLSSTVQESLNKADTALQTEQYKGTVTGVKINGTTNNPSNGVVDLGTVSVPTPVVSVSTTSQSIEPNKYYKWSSARSSLTITLATPKDTSILNNYMFEFPTSTSGCTLSVPSGIKWAHGEVPVFEPSVTYQVSIINNLAVVTKFA